MSGTTVSHLYANYFSKVFRAAPQGSRGSESTYRKYVRAFYSGNWMADGWIEQTEDIVGAAGPEVRQAMNKLGQRICGEWAKPNTMRKVSTDDLKRWGKAAKDNPSAEAIQARISQVERVLPKPLVHVVEYDTLEA